ncbi:MAG: serine/threonine-protein kinase [Planctomycetota bacterium]|nr:serine/threonine-protein kinase [Planctomycetota bacterium]MDA1179313.1 serine/threonine-protein kinase [Planctomycetota bacterium]
MPDDNDAQLAQLLDELNRCPADEQAEHLTRLQRLHPELADELTQLWGTMRLADVLGSELSVPVPAIDLQYRFELPLQMGDYRLLSEVGRGGMGVVFLAHQASLDRQVAVKMLLNGRWATPLDRARIRAEAAAAARLHHPHIVPVYEVGEQEAGVFFSMKYIAGETLADLLRDGPLVNREAARLLKIVSQAVEYAHCQGVLHRDLKPSNILLDEHGLPYVSDFGLAKSAAQSSNLTRTGAILGTPSYMAPEQAAGNRGQVGSWSDVYSLGSILYHMLTGRPPFQAASAVDTVLQLLEQDPPAPRVLNPQIDRDLEMITLRCLQKPHDLRYQSAAELVADLQAYLSDEPVSARSGQFLQVVARVFRETHHAAILENWGLLWMWHSLVVLVTCLLTSSLHHWNRQHGDAPRLPYFLLWTAGVGAWATVFWALRRRMGPVTFVERQVAHVWGASMISTAFLFPVEYLLGLPVLTMAPVLGISGGALFMVKAGILAGSFYVQAVVLFLTSLAMARWPDWAHLIFGPVAALCFFVPGWKYWRQRRRNLGQ